MVIEDLECNKLKKLSKYPCNQTRSRITKNHTFHFGEIVAIVVGALEPL